MSRDIYRLPSGGTEEPTKATCRAEATTLQAGTYHLGAVGDTRMNETFCPDCEGTGFTYVPDYYDYSQVAGRGQLCSLCQGTGLPVRTETGDEGGEGGREREGERGTIGG
jgi:hypothetical protein